MRIKMSCGEKEKVVDLNDQVEFAKQSVKYAWSILPKVSIERDAKPKKKKESFKERVARYAAQ